MTEFQLGPLIDCVFLLLTYFLFTISLTTAEGLLPSELALGEDNEQREMPLEEDKQEIFIRVVQTGGDVQYFINDWPVTDFGQVAEHLTSVPKESLVVIDAGPNVAYRHVVRLYNHCLRVEIAQVVFPITGGGGISGSAPRS